MNWKKLANESNEPKSIFLDTGLKGEKAKEILDAICGQMSDGMWENSPTMEHYWPYINAELVGGNAGFMVNTCYQERDFVENWFKTKVNLDKKSILIFMGKKLKAVAKEEIKDDPDVGEWDRENTNESQYIGGWDIKVTFQEIYFVYETLIGRSGFQGKYPEEVVKEFM